MLFFLRPFLRRLGQRVPGQDRPTLGSLTRTALYVVAIIAVHSGVIVAAEGLTAGDALWLTLTTLTTVGYGDVSASTPIGRAATVVILYAGGIFVVAKAAGDYFEYRADVRLRKITGRWRWNVQDHLLFVGAPQHGAEHYFQVVMTELAQTAWGQDRRAVILTDAWPDGLPARLRDLGVVHVHGTPDDDTALVNAGAAAAAAVVVLAVNEGDARADSVAFDTTHRLRALGSTSRIIVEHVRDANRERLRAAGADSVLRPMRAYPGMMVRALVAPGSEHIIETLFDSGGDECHRIEVPLKRVRWGELATALVKSGLGTALGLAETGGRVVCNPPADATIDAAAVFVLVKEEHKARLSDVRDVVSQMAAEVS